MQSWCKDRPWLRIADSWFFCALAERDSAAAERALVALGDNPGSPSPINPGHSFGEGLYGAHDQRVSKSTHSVKRSRPAKIVQAQPDYGPALRVLGLIDAALGRKDLALRKKAVERYRAHAAGKRCHQRQPRPSILRHHRSVGGRKGACLAATGSWAAFSAASLMLSYGALKLLPVQPLRGDPRFEKIVESLAPKEPPK